MLYNKDWDRPHSNPVSELLLKAADLLEKHGHVKFVRHDEKGSMCFLGAVEIAQGRSISLIGHQDSPLTHEAAQAVADTLGIKKRSDEPDIRFPVADWNNAKERTAQEVIDAMRLAARALVKENA